jgi:hypothetical protein
VILETQKKRTQIFLVLVPHRDIRLVLRNYSNALFKEGFAGAYHFPWVAPLAALSRPLNRKELKHCAGVLRNAAEGGKFNAGEVSRIAFPKEGGTELFGPLLNLALPHDTGGEKAAYLFPLTVIGACLLDADRAANAPASLPSPPIIPAAPRLSFSAAAAANLYWRPIKAGGAVTGCKWKIGPLCWLPPVRKDK